jgi:hypothetical protein
MERGKHKAKVRSGGGEVHVLVGLKKEKGVFVAYLA